MKKNMSKAANILAALLVIAVLVMTFLPNWRYSGTETQKVDGKSVKVTVTKEASINGYLWMIDNHKELTKIFEKSIIGDKFDTNELLVTPLVMLILGVVLLIFVIRHFDSIVAPCLAVAFGIVGLKGYLTPGVGSTFLTSGNIGVPWMVPVVLCAVIAVCGVVAFAFNIPALIKKLKGRY